MKKLTPEQARRLKDKIERRWEEMFPAYEDICIDIDELTAKPGDVEHCGFCKWWQSLGLFMGCDHPDYTPGVCPIGRHDEETKA